MFQSIIRKIKLRVKNSLTNGYLGIVQEHIANKNSKKNLTGQHTHFSITSINNLSPFYIVIHGIAYPRNKIKYIECFIDGKSIGIAENNISVFNIWKEKRNILNLPIKAGWQLFANLNEHVGEENNIIFKIYDNQNNIIDEYLLDIATNNTNNAPLADNVSVYRATSNMKDSLYYLSNIKSNKQNILIFDNHLRLDFYKQISDIMPDFNFIYLLTGIGKDINSIKQECIANNILSDIEWDSQNIFMMPDLLIRNSNITLRNYQLSDEILAYINDNKYLYLIIKKFNIRYRGCDISYAYLYAYYADKYIKQLLDLLKPKLVVLWCQFFLINELITFICNQKNIKLLYTENGLLTGTISVDKNGQLGESDVTLKWNEFVNLPVSDDEVTAAKKLCFKLNMQRENRWAIYNVYNKQVKNVVRKLLDKSKPTILFAGQNDYECGMNPYTSRSKKFHSPIFFSSYDAAKYISGLAEKNGWNFIYKKHPVMIAQDPKNIAGNAINAHNIDIHDAIDLADVVITIVSQTSYLALIQEKPVVMLGYTQLYKKDCTYEAFSLDDIEREIKNAIEFGYTDEQKENFYKHVAQLNKYYLFNNFTQNTYTHGQSIESLKEFIENYINEG